MLLNHEMKNTIALRNGVKLAKLSQECKIN